ncbi:MAG: ketoacyl-ACP synthase III [Bacteroidetes bacterium]|nr:ketoacyl-ACP synthase III [Bacteroidota bacterium]MCL2302543.1 ketoacyl-ACP synthase III [Lentimicrobiaceae bacterium]
MYINATGFYVPTRRVSNEYFLDVNGLTSDWILQRTGINTRSRVREEENGNTMGLAAVQAAIQKLPYSVKEVDLIISTGYTPMDTVGTLAHITQREFQMEHATAMMISSACSSFISALEIAEGYFCSGKAKKALVVCSENNSYYCNETDPQCGHLWGDAAVAMFVSNEKMTDSDPEIVNVVTRGLGHIGKGPEAVYLRPKGEGIAMPDGRDVFVNATRYMIEALEIITQRNNITIQDLTYIVPHQANSRIISNILNILNLPEEKALNNIHEYGNTGSASAILVMLENLAKFKKNDLVGLTVFGGGYSSGGALIRF